MTLCNKSFSATQFALLSALSAIGRVYVGPAAGWFVESWGWPSFYAFSVIAALPGLFLLAGCKSTLEYMQNHTDFLPRTAFNTGYRWAIRTIITGIILVAIWLIFLMLGRFGLNMPKGITTTLIESGCAFLAAGAAFGALLDFLSCRREEKRFP